MQRFLSPKLLYKTSKFLTNTRTTSSIYAKTSSFLTNTKYQSLQNHQFFFRYTTWSLCGPRDRVFSKQISNGFFSKPSISTKLLLSKNFPPRGHSTVKGLIRAQPARRNFHSNFSFDSNRRSWLQWLTPDNVVLGLILTNVAVFLLWRISDHSFMVDNFMISLDNFKSGRIHTLITSAFSHMDVAHLVYNMVGLYFFGTSVGTSFGGHYLLKLYLAGAVGGSVFYLVHHALIAPPSKRKSFWNLDRSDVPGLGASGAVNAIMLLDIFLFPKKTLYFDFIIPVPAILLGVFLIGRDMLRIMKGDSQISGAAHLGGAAVAAIAWAQIRRGYFRF